MLQCNVVNWVSLKMEGHLQLDRQALYKMMQGACLYKMKQGACLYENEAGCMSIWKWSRVHVDMKMKQGACLYENEAGCRACRYENEAGCMSIWKWSRMHVDMKMKQSACRYENEAACFELFLVLVRRKEGEDMIRLYCNGYCFLAFLPPEIYFCLSLHFWLHQT